MSHTEDYSALIAEFPELLFEGTILQKEVLAHFGLLFSAYALLEAAIQNCYIFSQLRASYLNGEIRSESAWEACHERAERRAFKATFGELLKLSSSCKELSGEMDNLLALNKKRNFFAHHFFREENEKMFSDKTALHLIYGINLLRKTIKEAEKLADIASMNILKEIYPNTDVISSVMNYTDSLRSEILKNPKMSFGWE